MGALISLFIQLLTLMVSVTLSLTMTIINLTVSVLARSARQPRRRTSRSKSGAGGLVLVAFVSLVAVAAVPRLAVFLVLLTAAVAVVWWLVKRSGGYRTMEASELARLLQNVRSMRGSQFEVFVAQVFGAMGYGVTIFGGSGDQGVDIVLTAKDGRVAVQCKNYAKPVGNKPVQEVYAGAKHHGCAQAWVVAPAGYTKGAFDLAKSVGVKLFDANSIQAWIGQVEVVARAREGDAASSAPSSGTDRTGTPRGVWHPHPDDDPAQVSPVVDRVSAQSEAQAEKDRADYDTLLYVYEEQLKLFERLCDLRDNGEVPSLSSIEKEWRENTAYISEEIEKILADLDILEGRNPGLVREERVSRRAQLATKHSELLERVG